MDGKTMARKNTLELLDLLLGGDAFADSGIDTLLATRTQEDEYLDFKDGRLLDDPNAARVLRQYVCGFANASGGALMIGIRAALPNGLEFPG